MGAPLGPGLANAFLARHEVQWLEKCPKEFKPLYYRRYVDDIFVLFSDANHLPKFLAYMNERHQNITFSTESELNQSLPFLNVSVSRDNNKFTTSVYRKPTFSGVYSNYCCFLPDDYKLGLIRTLIHRVFHIVSNFTKFHLEMDKLRGILLRNGYPANSFDRCLKSFLNRVFQTKRIVATVPKREVTILLNYLGPATLKVRTSLVKYLGKRLPSCKFRVVFKSSNRMSSWFTFKDKISKALRSKVVYQFQCGRCNSAYVGKTMRHLGVRAAEHLGRSALTGKPRK